MFHINFKKKESKNPFEGMPQMEGYVARNQNGFLGLYPSLPTKNTLFGIWNCGQVSTVLDTKMFPEITWESEPVKVTMFLQKCNQQ